MRRLILRAACFAALLATIARADAPVCGAWRPSDPRDLTPFFADGALRWDAAVNGLAGTDGSVEIVEDPLGSGRGVLRLADDAGPGGAPSGGASVQVGLRWTPTGRPASEPIRAVDELWFDLEVLVPSASFGASGTGRVALFELGERGLSREWLVEVDRAGAIVVRRRGGGATIHTAGTDATIRLDEWQRLRLMWRRHDPAARAGAIALQTSADGSVWSQRVEAAHGWTEPMGRFRLRCAAVEVPGGTPECWFAWIGWRTRFSAWESARSDEAMWADCAYDPFYWCHVMDVSSDAASLFGFLQRGEFSGSDRLEFEVRSAPSDAAPILDSGAFPPLDPVRGAAFVRLDGLAPDREHFARFIAVAPDGRRALSAWHAFRTLRPPGAAARKWRFGFQSCVVQSPYAKPFISNRALCGLGLDFMLQLGDWTYIDAHGSRAPAGDAESILAQHMEARSDLFEQRLRRETPWFHLWSDHDTGPNNWSGVWRGSTAPVSSLIAQYAAWDRPGDPFTRDEAHGLAIAEGEALFARGFLGAPYTGAWHRSFRHGRCEFFLVDPHTHRTSGADYLGPAQLGWLVQSMHATDAYILFVVSPGPVGDVQVNQDNWNAWWVERNAFLRALADPAIIPPSKRVIFIVGDRHVPFLSDRVSAIPEGGAGSAIGMEFNSSPAAAASFVGYRDDQFWDPEAGAPRGGVVRACRLDGSTAVVDALQGGANTIEPNDMLRTIGLVEVDEAAGTVRFVLLSGDTQEPFVDGSFGVFDSGPVPVVAPVCRADLDGDGEVRTPDLGLLLESFGGSDPAADLNGDGVVNTPDLGVLLSEFGRTCR